MSSNVKLLNFLISPIGVIGLMSLCIVIGFISYNIYWTLKDCDRRISLITELPSLVYILSHVIIFNSIIWFFAELAIIFIKL